MSVKTRFSKFGKGVKSHAPEILLVTGLIEGAASLYFTSKASVKANRIKKTREANTQKEKLAKTIDICKVYAPAAGFAFASAASICASHGIMRKRYAGVVAAYGALTTSFMEYRSRVREEVGKEKEEELYYGTNKEMVSVKITQKDGKERTVRKKMDVRTKNGLSPYAQRFYPEKALQEDDPCYVANYIHRIESYYNDDLKAYGHVYLNDIRHELGMDRDDVGQLVGWLYDPHKLKDVNGDNQIKIIRKTIAIPQEDGTNKFEDWIDFNVDGVIFGKMSRNEYNVGIQEEGSQGLEFSNKEEQ